jgi:hypothetical protein
MDRDAAVRASRRRQALDALAFEREREALLADQVQDVLAERDGPRVDAAVFARMSEDETALVRAALGDDAFPEDDEEDPPEDDDDFGFSPDFEDGDADRGEDDGEDDGDGVEEEIARLEAEIESSRRIQAALERYVELLSEPAAR